MTRTTETKKKLTKKQLDARFEKYASDKMRGRTIDEVRYLTQEEADGLGWHSRPIVLFLDNGTILFPSRDDEGNDGGVLFGQEISGNGSTTDLTFPVL